MRFATSDEASESQQQQDTVTVQGPQSRSDEDRQDYNLFLHYLRYAGIGSRFTLFGYAGPSLRRGWSRYVAEYRPNGPGYSVRRSEGTSRGIGADLGAGFEWFFSRRLSLGSRYGLVYFYQDSELKYVNEAYFGTSFARGTETSHSHGFVVESTHAVIMLSAYF